VNARQTKLRHLAGGLIAASVGGELLAIGVRIGWGGTPARPLEGATLFLAAGAYLAHALAHHDDRRELLTRSILVTAFALWGIVQIAPGLPDNAVSTTS
jgi:peptidoglycan/LPS O-acetylase OafA/YrhL